MRHKVRPDTGAHLVHVRACTLTQTHRLVHVPLTTKGSFMRYLHPSVNGADLPMGIDRDDKYYVIVGYHRCVLIAKIAKNYVLNPRCAKRSVTSQPHPLNGLVVIAHNATHGIKQAATSVVPVQRAGLCPPKTVTAYI